MSRATQEMLKRCVSLLYDLHLLLMLVEIIHPGYLASAQGSGIQNSVEVYKLSPSLLESNGSLVSSFLAPKQNELSVCVWTKIAYFRRPSVALSVGSREASIGDVSVGLVPRGVILRQGGSVWVAAARITPLTWYHTCLALTPSSVSLIFEGRKLLQVGAVTDYLTGNILILLGASVKWPDVSPSTFQTASPSEQSWDDLRAQADGNKVVGSFAGDIAYPRVWNVILSDDDFRRIANCKVVGTSTSRDLSQWQTTGLEISTTSMNEMEPCRRKRFDYVLFPEPVKYKENLELCLRMDMEMLRPRELEDREILNKDSLRYSGCNNGDRTVWLGTDDDNCFALENSQRVVVPCTTLLCGGCQLRAGYRRLFILRGLCPLPDFDLAFVAAPDYNYRPYFKGVERYDIKKNSNTNNWELIDITYNSVLATTSSPDPVGSLPWKLTAGICGNSEEVVVEASLSACQMEQNSCRNGACVVKGSRCDGYPHCPDGYDEEECQPVRIPKGYLVTAPPPNPPVEIKVKIDVTRVVTTEPLLLLLNTFMEWEDPRVSFSNLPYDIDHPIPLDATLWRPRLIVLAQGTTAPVDMVLTDDEHENDSRSKSSARLVAHTLATPAEDMRDTPNPDTIFPGSNTTLTLSEYVLRPIDCDFDMSFFPFDVHMCELSMALVPYGKKHVTLVIDSNAARYTGVTRLNDFSLDEVKIRKRDVKIGGREHCGIVLGMRLSRRSAFMIVSVILPSFLLLGISTASLWMTYQANSSARLIVNLSVTGAFLGMWLIAGLSSPATGRAKALDVWLCFCTMHSTLHALLHVFLDVFGHTDPPPLFSRVVSRAPSRMREVKPIESGSIYDNLMRVPESEENWTASYWITFIARVVSPALVVLFNAAFWPFVVYFSRNPLP